MVCMNHQTSQPDCKSQFDMIPIRGFLKVLTPHTPVETLKESIVYERSRQAKAAGEENEDSKAPQAFEIWFGRATEPTFE